TQESVSFYLDYIPLRDTYLQLFGYESEQEIEYPALRKELNSLYDAFLLKYGSLSEPKYRNQILKDAAFGFKIISSLEVKAGGGFRKADIFSGPLFFRKTLLQTDDPIEALARCLNDCGRVRLPVIMASTGLD